jgi:hypothetical protein
MTGWTGGVETRTAKFGESVVTLSLALFGKNTAMISPMIFEAMPDLTPFSARLARTRSAGCSKVAVEAMQRDIQRVAICVANEGCAASLELQKVYRVLTDAQGAMYRQVRVVDESGEDYLYPEEYFDPFHAHIVR